MLSSNFYVRACCLIRYVLAIELHGAKGWRILNDQLRWFCSNFGMVCTIVAVTGFC